MIRSNPWRKVAALRNQLAKEAVFAMLRAWIGAHDNFLENGEYRSPTHQPEKE
jgi:hypothetical protein